MNQHTKIDPIMIQLLSDEELSKLAHRKDLKAKEHFIIAKEIGDRAIERIH